MKKLYLKVYSFLQIAFVIFITLFVISTIFIDIDSQEFRSGMLGSAGIGLIFSFLYHLLD